MVTLEDITGTIGEWLDSNLDPEIPMAVLSSLELTYNLASEELRHNC